MKLNVRIEQDEAGYFVAEVPALPGCLSQGRTKAEAIENIHEAIEGWLEVMESKAAYPKDELIEVVIQMGAHLKLCSGAEAVKKLQRAGWQVSRQKGSHVMMIKEGYEYTLSVPQHSELGPGILRKLIKQANLSVEEFNAL